ncbi:hypothetical protein [Burkholderia sp. Ac-20344]|uniref:hypothetical protein n=1 Tax=Burkholderia sp. Ac-20344 TaxID=2703890 RepID=UPI00197B3C68|nr:hypothetical protein [Burkholderia sp. Ac-20344]MBN3835144.1 hypothetical protein [Burkholderia sp. Ac-20344]
MLRFMSPSVSERAIRVHCVVNADGLPALLSALRPDVVPPVLTGASGCWPMRNTNARHPVFTHIESQWPGKRSSGMTDGRNRNGTFKRALLFWSLRWQANTVVRRMRRRIGRETASAADESVNRTTRAAADRLPPPHA